MANRTLAGLLTVGVIIALALALFGAVREPTTVPSESTTVAAPVETAGAKAQAAPVVPAGPDLRAVVARLDRLTQRVTALEKRPAAAAEPAVAAPHAGADSADVAALRQELAALRRQVAQMSRREPMPVAKALEQDEAARQAVRDLVAQTAKQRQEERRARHRAMGEQVMDEMVNEFASRTGMSDQQVAQLYPALQELQEQMRINWRAMRSGEKDFTQVRAAAREARDRFDSQARAILNDSQYEEYQKEMERRFAGPGGLFR